MHVRAGFARRHLGNVSRLARSVSQLHSDGGCRLLPFCAELHWFTAFTPTILYISGYFKSCLAIYHNFLVDNELQIGSNQFLRNPVAVAAAARNDQNPRFGALFGDGE